MVVVGACGNKKEAVDPVEKDTTTDTTESGTVNDGASTTTENKVETADEASKLVTELEDVESATVLVTDKNAYVAVVLKDTTQTEASQQLEDEVAEKVRSSNAAIEKVYVSVNPDFVQRMTGYGDKIRNGEPVEGFFEEFSEAVKRVFPDAH
jgi:YhcN/YlaJ family sporulation lipoprotein